MDALKSDPLSLLYILTSAMGVGIFRGALQRAGVIPQIIAQEKKPKCTEVKKNGKKYIECCNSPNDCWTYE